jgi:hypothetical protein
VSARQTRGYHRREGLSTPLSSREILDNVVVAETPEGILLELRPAGVGVRFYAFLIDWLVRIAVLYIVANVTRFMGGIGIAFWFILLFALEWFYPVVFELTPSGATPGKRAHGLRVVMDTGLPVTPAASLARKSAARGRFPAAALRLCHREHDRAARLQAPWRHRSHYDGGMNRKR